MFDLRRLRLLHELALRGTLSAVAEALSYSPSTISQQLAQLEKEAGVPLFAPDGRRVRLTEHGMMLAAHAERALDLDERARAELESLDVAGPGGAGAGAAGIAPTTVRVAVLQTAVPSVLPDAMTLLSRRAPRVRLEVAQVPPEEGLFELSARRFDLVIAEQYPGHTRAHRAGLEREVLGVDPIRLALPPDDPATELAGLRDRAWIMEPEGTAARQWATQQCRAAGFEPDVRFEIADLTAHVRLIAAGHAVGVLPDLVWAGGVPGVRLVDLPGAPARELFTAARESSTDRPSIRSVRDALRDGFHAALAG
ncbi:MAG: LysR family transcriptional regulator [Microbacterium sp.]|nr:LysR family transcriptional regulator [Microbacterium sp.]